MEELFDFIYQHANKALATTPNYLPQLKNVYVIDSCGYGLTKFFEGMKTFLGKEKKPLSESKIINSRNLKFDIIGHGKLNYGYCCSFVLNLA